MSSLQFAVNLASARKPRPNDAELVFGRTFTDHMAIVDYEADRGWFDPRVVPYGPLTFDPAGAVLHYGQELFDGLKAFRGADGQVRVFRLDRHAKRMHDGGARLCMPAIDEALMRESVLALVRADRDWVPASPGTSLYIRPAMVATEPFLGVRPSRRYLYFVIASPVSGYGGEVFTPARIWVEDKYVRAAVGGLGAARRQHPRGRDARFDHHALARLGHAGERAARRHRRDPRGTPQRRAARGLRLRHGRRHHARGRARLARREARHQRRPGG
jgi:branched-chain amino acid aminotransferase